MTSSKIIAAILTSLISTSALAEKQCRATRVFGVIDNSSGSLSLKVAESSTGKLNPVILGIHDKNVERHLGKRVEMKGYIVENELTFIYYKSHELAPPLKPNAPPNVDFKLGKPKKCPKLVTANLKDS